MIVDKEHVECDSSGDAPDCYVWTFHVQGEVWSARQWHNEAGTVEILHWRDAAGGFRKFSSVPYESSAFKEVVSYLVQSEGLANVEVMVFVESKISPEMRMCELVRVLGVD